MRYLASFYQLAVETRYFASFYQLAVEARYLASNFWLRQNQNFHVNACTIDAKYRVSTIKQDMRLIIG